MKDWIERQDGKPWFVRMMRRRGVFSRAVKGYRHRAARRETQRRESWHK